MLWSTDFVYYQDGTYLQTLTNGFGCDSLLTIVVDVLQPSDSYLVAEACQSYVFNGENTIPASIYTQTLVNTEGCDSVITLDLLPLNQDPIPTMKLQIQAVVVFFQWPVLPSIRHLHSPSYQSVWL